MKRLLIMRHAKSSWAKPSQADYERPLNGRGRLSATAMGLKLKEEGVTPDLIICSSAERAKQTAELVAPESGYEGEIRISPDLYLAGVNTYFEMLHRYGENHDCVLVIGHNPTIEVLIDHYSSQSAYITTANVGHIVFDVGQWAEVDVHTAGRLLNLWRPKEL